MEKEDYVVKTARLAELVVEYAWNNSACKQKEEDPIIIEECCKVTISCDFALLCT